MGGEGTGSCHAARGCVYLLSGGQSTENSYLLDASANGDDVFFVVPCASSSKTTAGTTTCCMTRASTGWLPPAQAGCVGHGCQGVPPAPPIFATPASVTFNGVGNFPSESLTSGRRQPSR